MGEKLKALRIQNKYTQKQIASRIGLAISAVSSYESGARFPSYEVLARLARIYHVSADYLIGIETHRCIDVSELTEDEISLISQIVNTLRKKNLSK